MFPKLECIKHALVNDFSGNKITEQHLAKLFWPLNNKKNEYSIVAVEGKSSVGKDFFQVVYENEEVKVKHWTSAPFHKKDVCFGRPDVHRHQQYVLQKVLTSKCHPPAMTAKSMLTLAKSDIGTFNELLLKMNTPDKPEYAEKVFIEVMKHLSCAQKQKILTYVMSQQPRIVANAMLLGGKEFTSSTLEALRTVDSSKFPKKQYDAMEHNNYLTLAICELLSSVEAPEQLALITLIEKSDLTDAQKGFFLAGIEMQFERLKNDSKKRDQFLDFRKLLRFHYDKDRKGLVAECLKEIILQCRQVQADAADCQVFAMALKKNKLNQPTWSSKPAVVKVESTVITGKQKTTKPLIADGKQNSDDETSEEKMSGYKANKNNIMLTTFTKQPVQEDAPEESAEILPASSESELFNKEYDSLIADIRAESDYEVYKKDTATKCASLLLEKDPQSALHLLNRLILDEKVSKRHKINVVHSLHQKNIKFLYALINDTHYHQCLTHLLSLQSENDNTVLLTSLFAGTKPNAIFQVIDIVLKRENLDISQSMIAYIIKDLRVRKAGHPIFTEKHKQHVESFEGVDTKEIEEKMKPRWSQQPKIVSLPPAVQETPPENRAVKSEVVSAKPKKAPARSIQPQPLSLYESKWLNANQLVKGKIVKQALDAVLPGSLYNGSYRFFSRPDFDKISFENLFIPGIISDELHEVAQNSISFLIDNGYVETDEVESLLNKSFAQELDRALKHKIMKNTLII